MLIGSLLKKERKEKKEKEEKKRKEKKRIKTNSGGEETWILWAPFIVFTPPLLQHLSILIPQGYFHSS